MFWKWMHPLAFIGLSYVTGTYLPAFRSWPLIWLVPLLGYFALVVLIRPLRATFRPWRFGTVSKKLSPPPPPSLSSPARCSPPSIS